MKMRWVIAALAAALSGTTWAEGNARAGWDKATMCGGCHGKTGNSETPIFPKLAGQHVGYLTRQLRDFRDQKRVDPSMNAIAGNLSDQDIDDLVAYYATQGTVAEPPSNSPLGKRVYVMGNANGAPACTGCHSPSGTGNIPARYPALAGQHAAYVAKALSDFKTQQRNNDANGIMRAVAAKLSEEEINALADYIVGLSATR